MLQDCFCSVVSIRAEDFVFRQPRNPVFQQFSECNGFKIARIQSGAGSSTNSICCAKMPDSPLFVRMWESTEVFAQNSRTGYPK
jgi:hypothetical protein